MNPSSDRHKSSKSGGDKPRDDSSSPSSSSSGGADSRVTTFKGFQLSAFQIQSVEAIRRGENLLVSAPTGAGKTLVAEYAIYDAVKRGNLEGAGIREFLPKPFKTRTIAEAIRQALSRNGGSAVAATA